MSIKTGTGMSIAGHDEALGFEAGGGLGEMTRHTTKHNGFSDTFARAQTTIMSGHATDSFNIQGGGVYFSPFSFTHNEDTTAEAEARATNHRYG